MTDRLLDTHVAVWAAIRPERLPQGVAELLADRAEGAFVSSVSIAEMAIKQALGKLELPVAPMEMCTRLGFSGLDLTWLHADGVAALPPIHRDPFDRLLVAQALAEGMPIVTADRAIARYPGVTVVGI